MRIVRRQKIEGHVGRHHLHVHGSHGAGLHFQGYKGKKRKKKSQKRVRMGLRLSVVRSDRTSGAQSITDGKRLE